MYKELIPQQGNWYKANLHCHTNISDGQNTPEEIKEFYKSHGYHAVCYTDHEVLIGHPDLNDDSFVALHGYEAAIKQDIRKNTAYFMPVYHLNMIAKDPKNRTIPCFFKENPSYPGNARTWSKEQKYNEQIDSTYYSTEWINRYTEKLKKAGFLITLNHPQWSLQSEKDYVSLEHLHAIEAFNGGCRYHNDNTSFHFQTLLRAGKRVVPVGGDDNHSADDRGHAWTMIKAPVLTYEALIDAYEKGYCYASEGPEIRSLIVDGDKIKVTTSPAAAIVLLSEGRHVQVSTDCSEAEFTYDPQKFGHYFRIEVRDTAGYKAISNAYYLEEIK